MEEARVVLERLRRIDELERRGAAPSDVLTEVRALLVDAEAWARREGADADDARSALATARRALAQGREPVPAG